MKHTAEPWLVDIDEHGQIHIVESDGNRAIAKVFHGRPDAKECANRLVACVNAFAGVELEKFEGSDVAEYVAKEAFIQGMQPCEGGWGMQLSGLACQMLAASFAGQFVGSKATNFLEVNMSHPEIGPFSVTIQRTHGKTPATLKAEADQQRDEAVAKLAEIINSPEWAEFVSQKNNRQQG